VFLRCQRQKEKPLSLRTIASRQSSEQNRRYIFVLRTATTYKNINLENCCAGIFPVSGTSLHSMLLDASEGMIFRDSGFCKEELCRKTFSHTELQSEPVTIELLPQKISSANVGRPSATTTFLHLAEHLSPPNT